MDNDFHQTDGIFKLLKGFEAKDMDKTPTIPEALTNGDHPVSGPGTNGVKHHVNGA